MAGPDGRRLWDADQVDRRPEGALRVAGTTIDDPVKVLTDYATDHWKSLRVYDGGGAGDPHAIALADVKRTRVIASRISNVEAEWFVERGETAPWACVPDGARLWDADPDERGGLYDDAVALFDHFRGRPGVAAAKISKVLHLKRPRLVPILDSHLLGTYRAAASKAAQRHSNPLGNERMYWAAIRADVIDPDNAARLVNIRAELRRSDRTRILADLSDIRLLDIVTWKRG
jgi:hypothetical protein